MFNRFISAYFGFNRQQRNGLWLLLLVSFLLLLVRLIYPYFMAPAQILVEDLPLIERKIDSAYAVSAHVRKVNKPRVVLKQPALFIFDPNSVSLEQLIQLGFQQKTAATLLKFRKNGMIFKRKGDLQKVYGVSDQLYARLEPYVSISPAPVHSARAHPSDKNAERVTVKVLTTEIIELNTTDSAGLLALSGIGPVYAKSILKYRALLGGYEKVEQLKEVYGLTEVLYEKIRPFVKVNVSLIKKINLNKDNFKSLNKHPYLSYELTKLIFDWRRKTILTPSNLKDILNDEVLYAKLLPYLVFD